MIYSSLFKLDAPNNIQYEHPGLSSMYCSFQVTRSLPNEHFSRSFSKQNLLTLYVLCRCNKIHQGNTHVWNNCTEITEVSGLPNKFKCPHVLGFQRINLCLEDYTGFGNLVPKLENCDELLIRKIGFQVTNYFLIFCSRFTDRLEKNVVKF